MTGGRKELGAMFSEGVGTIVTDLFEGRDKYGRPYCNCLVRLSGNLLVRLNFWGHSARDVSEHMGVPASKGVEVEFKGFYSGTYQEKPSINVKLENLKVLG